MQEMTKSSFPGMFFQKMDGNCASPISYTKGIKSSKHRQWSTGACPCFGAENTFTDVFDMTAVPVTLATSESTFSALRRLKTYLRSTMKCRTA